MTLLEKHVKLKRKIIFTKEVVHIKKKKINQ